MRGIDTDLKQDKAGSDKRYSFCLSPDNPGSRYLEVFESPIDALSAASLQQRKGWQWDGYRLSLGGTSSYALMAFLERNPHISEIVLHLDNDPAGIEAMHRIKEQLNTDPRFKKLRVKVSAPRGAKDYSDLLLQDVVKEQEQHPGKEHSAGVSLS